MYDIANKLVDKPILNGFSSLELAELALPYAAENYGYKLDEIEVRLTPKQPRPKKFKFSDFPIGEGESRERERAFLQNPLGIVPQIVRNEVDVRKVFAIVNGYNQEIRELRLEIVEVTHNINKVLDAMRKPGSYRGTWTVWLKCNDLRALINLGWFIGRDIH